MYHRGSDTFPIAASSCILTSRVLSSKSDTRFDLFGNSWCETSQLSKNAPRIVSHWGTFPSGRARLTNKPIDRFVSHFFLGSIERIEISDDFEISSGNLRSASFQRPIHISIRDVSGRMPLVFGSGSYPLLADSPTVSINFSKSLKSWPKLPRVLLIRIIVFVRDEFYGDLK